MTASGQPAFYDDLHETLAEAWRLLERGVADRRHGFHHPVLATVGLDGAPEARIVVLRSVMAETNGLTFHTDIRSTKIAEIQANPLVTMHFYDEKRKIQIRIRGHASLNTGDAVARARWDGSRALSRVCYSVEPGPGTAIPESGGFRLVQPPALGDQPGFDRFVVVSVAVERLEWLYLAFDGHRRARFTYDAHGASRGEWLAP